MADPFLGEVRLFAFGQAPQGWAMCNGQFLPINQNQALFSLLGTMYGGNGQTTFALPDLRGACAMHVGGSHATIGEKAGQEAHTVTQSEMPQHIHVLNAFAGDGDQILPGGNMLSNFNNGYRQPTNLIAINPGTVGNVGGSQPHNNMSPYLVINFCIALIGIFPSRN
jgi:microcystin-dependent protein